jgi:hypothetical protein
MNNKRKSVREAKTKQKRLPPVRIPLPFDVAFPALLAVKPASKSKKSIE